MPLSRRALALSLATSPALAGQEFTGGDNPPRIARNAMVFPSAIAAENARINADNAAVLTCGYYRPGDGGGGTYRRASPLEAKQLGAFHSIDGAVWTPAANGLINVLAFGARGDGVTDNTAAMQAAHNTGQTIYYPASEHPYVFRQLEIRRGGIVGDGGATVLQSNSAAPKPAINIRSSASDPAPCFEKFSLLGPKAILDSAPLPVGIGITPPSPSDTIHFLRFNDVTLRYWGIGIDLTHAASVRVSRCDFFFYTQAALIIANPGAPDIGDSSISSCTFFNGNGADYGPIGTAIRQFSGGGLRILNNKFNGGRHGYIMLVRSSTSDLLISGNSFEQCSGEAIGVHPHPQEGDGPRFNNIIVTGNQFARNARDVLVARLPPHAYWDSLVVNSNAFTYRGMAASVELHSTRAFSVAHNTFFGEGTGNIPVWVHDTCTEGHISNVYSSLRSPARVDGTLMLP